MDDKIRNKFIEIEYHVSNGPQCFMPSFKIIRLLVLKKKIFNAAILIIETLIKVIEKQ